MPRPRLSEPMLTLLREWGFLHPAQHFLLRKKMIRTANALCRQGFIQEHPATGKGLFGNFCGYSLTTKGVEWCLKDLHKRLRQSGVCLPENGL